MWTWSPKTHIIIYGRVFHGGHNWMLRRVCDGCCVIAKLLPCSPGGMKPHWYMMLQNHCYISKSNYQKELSIEEDFIFIQDISSVELGRFPLLSQIILEFSLGHQRWSKWSILSSKNWGAVSQLAMPGTGWFCENGGHTEVWAMGWPTLLCIQMLLQG